MVSPLQSPIIPSTVVDQINLWQMERDRLQFSDGECFHGNPFKCVLLSTCTHTGVLYSQFMSLNDYEILKNYAEVNPFV